MAMPQRDNAIEEIKRLGALLEYAVEPLCINFLDHLILGSSDCEEGRGFVSVMEQSAS